MHWFWLLGFAVIARCIVNPCAAADTYAFPEPRQCVAPTETLALLEEDEANWTPCEKWVWSCIRKGKEANLYHKELDCIEPRSRLSDELRIKDKYAAFYQPDRLETSNGLRGSFLRKILWRPWYSDQISPYGIRIYGGYFKDLVNLENITTSKNIVLDGSIFKSGLRLYNFRSEKNLSFDNSNIRGGLAMFRLRIDGSLFLTEGIYDTVDMRDARIGSSIDAERSLFNGEFRLDRMRVEGNVDLAKSRLTALNAISTYIGGSLSLRLADIRARVDLTGANVDGDVVLQSVLFGRRRPSAQPTCDWNLAVPGDYILQADDQGELVEKDAYPSLLEEGVRTALNRPGEETPDYCNETAIPKQLLLRDMHIKGRLCLAEVTGEIEATPGTTDSLETISLSGTQADSTILHWVNSHSRTLWQAINFKTDYLLMTLPDKPPQHLMDNIDVGFVALAKEGAGVGYSQPTDGSLCDVNQTEALPLGAPDRDERLVDFFTGASNRSQSAQSFAKIVERLQAAGSASTYLRNKLIDFKIAKANVCQTSTLWDRNSEKDADWRDAFVQHGKRVLDNICLMSSGAYKYVPFLKGDPYVAIFVFDLLVFIVAMVLLFRMALLFDGSGLGLGYCIDMFHPFPQIRFDRAHADASPQSRWLQVYLKVYRLIGWPSTVLLVVLVYFAAK